MSYPIARIKTWIAGENLTASDLNTEFNNVITNMTPSSFDDASVDVADMQETIDPGGVGTESRATTLKGEIQRLRFVIKRLFSGAQWYSTPARDFYNALNLQTADFTNDSVTQPKRGAATYEDSSLIDGVTESGATFSDVPGLTVTITTLGRPVLIALVSDDSFYVGYFDDTNPISTLTLAAELKLVRDSTDVLKTAVSIGQNIITGLRPVIGNSTNLGTLKHIDVVPAGTYTYKIQARGTDSVTFSSDLDFYGMKLVAVEL